MVTEIDLEFAGSGETSICVRSFVRSSFSALYYKRAKTSGNNREREADKIVQTFI